MRFLQNFWQVIKNDIIDFFNDFHKHGTFIKSINSTFVVFIPKKDCGREFSDFMPTSLMGSIYKLLFKDLAKRLSKVLNQIIGDSNYDLQRDSERLDKKRREWNTL